MHLQGKEAVSTVGFLSGEAKLNILIVGHGCQPESGSEQGVTWNWAWHLAKRHRVWVITHGYFRPPIERYIRDNPRPNLRFIWVGPLGWLDPWNGMKPRGIRLHYLMWQRASVRAAKQLIAEEPIDVVHHISMCTLSAPPLLWRTDKPFVWGPIGGGQVAPWRFLAPFGRAAPPEVFRTLRVALMPWVPALRRTVLKADLILAANQETAAVLRKAGARGISLLSDIGIPTALLQPRKTARTNGAPLTVLWAGRLEHWKGVALCLDVAKAVRMQGVRFLIAGRGPLRHWAERRANDLGLAACLTFLDQLSWPDMQQRFAEADLFLFTSLRDTFGTVNFEAMAKGCPVICLDHTGVGTHLPDDAAIKVPVTTPREVVKEMARQIEALATDRARLQRMSEAAYNFAATQHWENRALLMEQLYRQVLRQHVAGQTIAADR